MPSLSFYDAFDKQTDRIDKKRKENREAFEAYRNMKAELGEDVSAAELQRYRESLAGGDSFFLRDMGPGALVDDLAKRTNERALRTRQKEQADRVQEVQKTVDFFDTFVGNNLDSDPTDIDGKKNDFMKLFPDTPDLAAEIWTQHSGRFTETLLAKRAEQAASYADTRLNGVDNVDEAMAIMRADGLKGWKLQAVTDTIKQRENSSFRGNAAKAVEAAQTTDSVNLLYSDDDDLERLAKRIMRANQIMEGSEGYADVLEEVTLALKDRKSATSAEDLIKRTDAFAKAIRDPNNAFYRTIKAAGYDNEDLLDAYNELRREHRLSTAESIDDEEFQNWKNSMENEESIQHEIRYTAEVKRLTELGDASYEEAKGLWKGLSVYEDLTTEGSAVLAAMTALQTRGYALMQPPAVVYAWLKQSIGAEKLREVKADGNTESNIADAMIQQGFVGNAVMFRNAATSSNNYVEPGTTWSQWTFDQIKETQDYLNAEIQAEIHSLPINASADQIQAKREAAQQKLDEAIEDMEVFAKLNRGAFNGEIGEFQAQVGELKAKMQAEFDQFFADPEKMRGKRLPGNAFINTPRGWQPTVAALQADPPYVDANGRPLERNMLYTLEDGRLVPRPATTAAQGGTLPSISMPNPRTMPSVGTVSRQLQPLKDAIANWDQNPNQSVMGFYPDINVLPPGYQGPQAQLASIISKIAQAYSQDQSLSGGVRRWMSDPANVANALGYPNIASAF